MNRGFRLEEQHPLFLRDSSFEPSFEVAATEFRYPSVEVEPRSEGYDEYFDPPLESKYECPICLLGLREPVQTSCGHRFCKGCIVRSIRDAGPKCPVDNERLSESQLYPDNFAKREMMDQDVFCRMKKQHGCTWKGKLGKLQEHLNVCDFIDVKCPKKCGREMQRKDLKEHLEKECPNRTLPCKHCKNEIMWNELEDHYGNCPKFPVKCDSCKKENIPRESLKEHLDKECPAVKLKCPFYIVGCLYEGLRIAVIEHVTKELPNHAMEMAKKLGELVETGSGSHDMGGQRNASGTQRPRGGAEAFPREQASQEGYLHDLSSRTQTQRDEIDELRRKVAEMSNLIHHLERQLEETRMRQERPIQELTLRFNRYETKLLEVEGRLCNGSYIWKIDNFRQCRQDAVNGVMTAIHSPAFHTSLYGYKLCMRINLNGVDSGVGKHVALFVHMMQGDYDSILEWPFTGRIALSILDQSDGAEYRHHISETLVAKPNLLAFQRPTAPRNYKGYGYVEFAPIDTIREPQYVRNNTMLVRIQIFH
ncbi:TNF receptor-associated factor 6-like [Stylophora pistillata]|uniref:RING-type E3 ubiquitin transferase n=1 Tax=Stylophora pistillata TaxID=50429 RepID=A0A2B4RE08_STYPI|nr:TNF receptor-associated factor 6-like [Stylophora pistillata]PFX14515.1 TNF receptor-associated factor 6 [Stylophora pistillata]